jgi:hypothetical protein
MSQKSANGIRADSRFFMAAVAQAAIGGNCQR